MNHENHSPAELDHIALENARRSWDLFAQATKYGIIAVAALLVVMGIALL